MPDALIRLSEPDQPVLAGPKRDAARAFANAALAPSTRGRRLRPVASVRLWLDAAEGPVFRPVLKGGLCNPRR